MTVEAAVQGCPIFHVHFDRVDFDLWCEDVWIEQSRKEGHGGDVSSYTYIYEPDILFAFLHFIRPGDTCIDGGANLGYHTLFMSHLVGQGGCVLGFEPDPAHFATLESNIKLNNRDNIQIFNYALWNGVGEIDFWSIKGGGYSSIARFSNMAPTKVQVRAVRLDDIKALGHIRMIKLDCEGAEEQILRGGKDTLAHTDCVIIEFNYQIMGAFDASDRKIRDYMKEQGFDLYVLQKDGSEPFFVPHDVEIIVQGRKPHTFNGLFVKPGIYEIKTVTA